MIRLQVRTKICVLFIFSFHAIRYLLWSPHISAFQSRERNDPLNIKNYQCGNVIKYHRIYQVMFFVWKMQKNDVKWKFFWRMHSKNTRSHQSSIYELALFYCCLSVFEWKIIFPLAKQKEKLRFTFEIAPLGTMLNRLLNDSSTPFEGTFHESKIKLHLWKSDQMKQSKAEIKSKFCIKGECFATFMEIEPIRSILTKLHYFSEIVLTYFECSFCQ